MQTNLYFYRNLTNENFMDPLQPGQIRVHLKGGESYDCPEQNKKSVTHCITNVARIEHYKPPKAAPPPDAKPEAPKVAEKTRESLLGKLLKKGKISADDLIKWIEGCKDIGDLAIVMKDEGRSTPKAAYKKRLNELI